MSALQRKYFGRRRGSSRTSSRSFFRRKRGGSRGEGGNPLGLILGAAIYGAGREWTSQKLAPLTRPIAGIAGQYADEVVMGGLGYLLMKGKIPFLGKFKLARDIGKAALIIESARIGSGVGGGLLQGATTGSGQIQTLYY